MEAKNLNKDDNEESKIGSNGVTYSKKVVDFENGESVNICESSVPDVGNAETNQITQVDNKDVNDNVTGKKDVNMEAVMNALNEKIEKVEMFRDTYFHMYPEASATDRSKAVREAALLLLEEIPLDLCGSASSATFNLIYSRILNTCVEYDPMCEAHLILALKLDPFMHQAWYEMGVCLCKKKDWSGAVEAFEKAVRGHRCSKYLSALAINLRQLPSSNFASEAARLASYEYAKDLCVEAVKLEKHNGIAWHALANSHLTLFFLMGQTEPISLKFAIRAYAKALKYGHPATFGDIHLNYATASKFDQDYQNCLQQLRLAVKTGSVEATERLKILSSFLFNISQAVAKQGSVTAKRLREYQKSLGEHDLGFYQFDRNFSKSKKPVYVQFKDLKNGLNEDVVIAGKVIAIIPNRDVIPFVFIVCDKDGERLAFAVYNFSDLFTVVLGNSFCVANPYVLNVSVDLEAKDISQAKDQKAVDMNADRNIHISFKVVRVMNPMSLLKNGKVLSKECVAYCTTEASWN